MTKPVFQNVHYITTLYFPTPEGVDCSIHPGEYVIGEYFMHYEQKGLFERVEIDITEVPAHKIIYEQKR